MKQFTTATNPAAFAAYAAEKAGAVSRFSIESWTARNAIEQNFAPAAVVTAAPRPTMA